MYIGQCTSWVSWKINQAAGYSSLTGYHPFTNNNVFGNAVHLGNAVNWKDALSLYYPVNNTPAPGAIGWYRDHTSDPDGGGGISGHVTFINCMAGNSVTLTEYNFVSCQYDTRTIDISQPFQAGNRKPDSYIHIEAGGYGAVSGIQQTPNIESAFTVYPNPSVGIINISIDEVSQVGNGHLIVCNMLGQEILSIATNTSKDYSCDLSDKPAGVYFVKYVLNTGRIVDTKRFVILR